MILPRREFLRLLGVAAGAAGAGGCRLWSVPDNLVEMAQRGPGLDSQVQTVCGLCESGCGLTIRQVDGVPVGIKGNVHHPLNRGGVCPVGHAGLDLLYAPDRLQEPLRRDGDGLVSTTWDEALDEITTRLSGLDDGNRVALLSGEPGTLFNDLARQLLHTLDSPHFARVGQPVHEAYELSQGIDQMPGYDLYRADVVLSVGLDPFTEGEVPLHAIAALVGERSTEERATILHAGTRTLPGIAGAEQHVILEPGTHTAFALGVAHALVREGGYDRGFVEEHCFGFEDWRDESGRERTGFRRLLLERYYPDRVASLCGCDPADITRTARRFAAASTPVAVAGSEAVQTSNGTWAAMAVHALNALVGAFDRDGAITLAPSIPFRPMPTTNSPSGAPFAARPWGRGNADPAAALADAVLDDGVEIDVLLIVNADPVHESVAGDRVRQALQRIPLVVSLTSFVDETAAAADLVLPASLYLESWQGTTTPPTVAFSNVGFAQPVLQPLYDTRHPGDVLLSLAAAVAPDSDALPWNTWSDYLQDRMEGLVDSGEGAIVTGSFEESWAHFLEERGWRFQEHRSADEYREELLRQAGWWNPVQAGGDWSRIFPTDSKRYEFYSRRLQRRLQELGAAAGDVDPDSSEALLRGAEALGLEADEEELCLPHFEPPQLHGEGELTMVPFRPMTARGRLGIRSRMVLEMFGYPVLSGWQTWAQLSPETARELDLGDGDHVALESEAGSIEVVVKVVRGTAPHSVHVPLGLGHRAGEGPAVGIGANPLVASSPARDPLSGAPALVATRVRPRLIRRREHGAPAPTEGLEHSA